MDVWQIITSIISVIGCIAGVIANFLYKKYEHKTNKQMAEQQRLYSSELEKLKGKIGTKTHMSIVRFEAEFQVYRELSGAFFDLNKYICAMIPPPDFPDYYSPGKDKQLDSDKDRYDTAAKYCLIAQDVLHKNAAFIPEAFFDSFRELLDHANRQMLFFGCMIHNNKINDGARQIQPSQPERLLSRTINDKLRDLNSEIRCYLTDMQIESCRNYSLRSERGNRVLL
jgi:hypothetical protein